jgi:two-component system OmpR family response regulator
MLTGKGDIEDKIVGFEAGVDDYLTKPFDLRELLSRLNALLRRGTVSPTRVTTVGPLKLDPDRHRVDAGGAELKLTATEFALLDCLCRRPNHVFSPGALLGRVWDSSSEVSPDTVRVYIRRLRDKLSAVGHPDLIENVHGVGYKLSLPDA